MLGELSEQVNNVHLYLNLHLYQRRFLCLHVYLYLYLGLFPGFAGFVYIGVLRLRRVPLLLLNAVPSSIENVYMQGLIQGQRNAYALNSKTVGGAL